MPHSVVLTLSEILVNVKKKNWAEGSKATADTTVTLACYTTGPFVIGAI